MCNPAAVQIGLTLAAATYTGVQQHAQGQYQEAVQNNNAQVAEGQAKDAVKRGDVAAQKQVQNTQQIQGAQRAAIGASGVESDTGTTGQILTQTAQYGALDAAQIRANALREAWGYKAQASNYQAQGQLDKLSGDNAATGTILNGVVKAYGSYAPRGGSI